MTRWERITEWPLAGLAALFLAAYAWPILDPGLAETWQRLCSVTVGAVWAAFAVDYGVRLRLAEDRREWFRRHLIDLAVIALPLLRPLRLLRLVTLLRVVNRRATSSLRGRVGLYVGVGSALLAFVSALAVLDAERGKPGAGITTFGDALWWAATTMTTVGYGDLFPVTSTGRFVGVGLMVAGIGLLGTVTATLASWLVERVSAETASALEAADETQDAEDAAEYLALQGEIRALRGQWSDLLTEIRLDRRDSR